VAISLICGVAQLSVALVVKLYVPAAVGVPEIVQLPVPVRLSPGGKLPDAMLHVTGA
jgi:hypothetical protein